MPILMMLLKYRKYIIVVIAVLSLLGSVRYYGHVSYTNGYDTATSACETQKRNAFNESIKVRTEQDAVIRANDATYINSLRSGNF